MKIVLVILIFYDYLKNFNNLDYLKFTTRKSVVNVHTHHYAININNSFL